MHHNPHMLVRNQLAPLLEPLLRQNIHDCFDCVCCRPLGHFAIAISPITNLCHPAQSGAG